MCVCVGLLSAVLTATTLEMDSEIHFPLVLKFKTVMNQFNPFHIITVYFFKIH
jgi:hypothetical protein